MHYVSGDRVTVGQYHFSQNFISFSALLGGYSPKNMIPVGLGWPILAVAAFNLALLAVCWRAWSSRQRVFVAFALAMFLFYSLLMTQISQPIWEAIPLLGRTQFPWRILSVASLLLALLAGAWPAWRWPRVRIAIGAIAVIAMCLAAIPSTSHKMVLANIPETVETLMAVNFTPDQAAEWVPHGAKPAILPQESRDRVVTLSGSPIRVIQFERGQGRIACRLQSPRPESLVLPHYFFPGWTCKVQGTAAELKPGPDGLMLVSVPAGRDISVEVTFHATKARTFGLWVSAVSAAVGILLLGLLHRIAGRLTKSAHPT
jgi:hypothetical protein